MSKVIAVTGATGGQGGSVINALLSLPNSPYTIRGITRNTNSAAAKALSAKGVSLVTADLNDEASLVAAFTGAHAIYAVTDFFEPFNAGGPEHAKTVEYAQGVNMARAALQTPTLEHYIWSTLPDAATISDGKHQVPHFESKVAIDAFIKSQPALLAKTTFLWITFYAANLLYPIFTPAFLKPAGTYAWLLPSPPSMQLSSVGDHRVNVGIMVRGILSNPAKTLRGKYVLGRVEILTSQQYLDLWAKVTGKTAQFIRISYEDYYKLYPNWGEEMGRMLKLWEEVGEKSWSGQELITPEEIGVQGELRTTEEALKGIDFSGVC